MRRNLPFLPFFWPNNVARASGMDGLYTKSGIKLGKTEQWEGSSHFSLILSVFGHFCPFGAILAYFGLFGPPWDPPKKHDFFEKNAAIAQRARAHTGGAHICCTHTAPTHMGIVVGLLSPPVEIGTPWPIAPPCAGGDVGRAYLSHPPPPHPRGYWGGGPLSSCKPEKMEPPPCPGPIW